MSETIRVSKKTKEALLRVAARLQERTGKRVDFEEAINHLVNLEDRKPDTFMSFVGSIKGVEPEVLLDELAKERRRDEFGARRKYGT